MRDKRRYGSGSRIHNGIIGRPRPDGGPALDQRRPCWSYCTGETRVEVATPSRRHPAPRGVVSGDLSTIAGARTVAEEVNRLGPFDAVIHNAGVGYREGRVEVEPGVPSVFAVNVLAPYILTALIERPKRLVYVSSGMHRGVHPRMDDLLWTKEIMERLVGLRREQAVRCIAGICGRSPLERRQIQRAGTRMGSDKNGRSFGPGRSSPGMCHPGLARHERGRAGAIDGWVFLSSTPSCAEPNRGGP